MGGGRLFLTYEALFLEIELPKANENGVSHCANPWTPKLFRDAKQFALEVQDILDDLLTP